MKVGLPLTLVFATTFLSASVKAQQKHPTLLALSKGDHILALVNPTSLQVVAKAPVGQDPHEVIASTDGRTAYVSNYGFGALHTLARVDLVHHLALSAIDLGALTGPHGLTFVDGKVWFTAEGAKAIGRYDPEAQTVDWILGTGQNRTHMIYVAPDARTLVTTNVASGTVDLISLEEARIGPPLGGPRSQAHPPDGGRRPDPPSGPHLDWEETVVKVGNGSEGFDLSPDGKEIWVGNAQDGTISIIDRASKSVIQTLHAEIRGANRLKFTPDGRHVLISTLGESGLVIFDAQSRSLFKRVSVGHGAAGILMEPGGQRAFVACTPDNYIAVVDLSSFTVTGHIDIGPEPDGLAWADVP